MISLEKSVSTWQFPVNKVIKFGPCWEAPYLWLVTYGQWHYRISSENGGRIIKTPALIAAAPFPFPLFRAFLPPPSPSPFCSFMRWKIFQWMELLLGHSSNSRELSWQKFHNELACVFTAHYASKNADWNQQQLTDGGILANWNSANHPYCFLSNQKKVQILAFLHVIRQRNVSCPLPVRDIRGIIGRGRDLRLGSSNFGGLFDAATSNI